MMTTPGMRSEAGVATPHSVSTSAAPPQPATSAVSGAARPAVTSRPHPMSAAAAASTPAQPARSSHVGMSKSILTGPQRPRFSAGRY